MPPGTRGKTAEGVAPEFARYRRLKKTAGIPAWPAAKNPARDGTCSCEYSGDRAAAAGCPRVLKPRARKSAALHAEFPHPHCASGPAGRGVDQGIRFYRSRPVRRGNTIFAGTGICSGPGRGNCATPGFIRTDVGMPVADHRIDMCRTGPPCNATAGKAGNDTSNSPACLPS